MNGKPVKALMFKESLNQGLAETVAALDREHYPDSLLEIIEAVLLDRSCLRGLPLLAFAINRPGTDAEHCYQSAEIIWQGMLLTALLAVEEDDPADGLVAGLVQGYDKAHLLLAADTLLTLPFEFCTEESGTGRAGRLACCARKVLESVDGLGGELTGLAGWRPLEPLLTELCPGVDQNVITKLSGLIDLAYASDLIRCLGPRQWLKSMRERALKAVARQNTRPELQDVCSLLNG
jgi:hypothetical protein